MIKTTDQLSSQELLTILQARTAVFVVEQNCPYQEVDEIDREAIHVCLMEQDKLQAYARIYETSNGIHFGRVMVVKEFRGHQLGRKLVTETLEAIEERFPQRSVIISAQAHLIDFYQSFGFTAWSEIYLEDDIPHMDMRLEKTTNH